MRVVVTLLLFVFSCNLNEPTFYILEKVYNEIERNPTKAIELSTQIILDKATKDFHKSQAFFIRAYLTNTSDIESSLWDYLESYRFLELSGKTDNDSEYRKSDILNNIGSIYFTFQQYEYAYKYYRQSLEFSGDINRKNLLYNLAITCSRQKRFDESNKYLSELKELVNEPDFLNDLETRLALNNTATGNYKESINSFNKMIKSESISEEVRAKTYHNLAVAYVNQMDTLKAIESLNKAISIHKLNGDKSYIFASLSVLTELYFMAGWIPQTIATGALTERLYDDVIHSKENFKFFKYLARAHDINNEPEVASSYWKKYSDELEAYDKIKSSTHASIEDKIALLAIRYQNEAELRAHKANVLNTLIYLIAGLAAIIFVVKKYSLIQLTFSEKLKF